MSDMSTKLGPLLLRSPLIAASGTVGSVTDFSATIDFRVYGAAVAKSVSKEPWEGRPSPRLAPAEGGMLNGIGIQNPGIEAWEREVGPRLADVDVPIWGSAVGHRPSEFAFVAEGLERAGVAAVEVNLSCPNLDDGQMFALDAEAAAEVIGHVRRATSLPLGAKLSPDATAIVPIAEAVATAGADWVVLTNTISAVGFDAETRRPLLSGVVGGYSGSPLKPIALRCVWEVAQALAGLPIVGCGGVRSGNDVVEFLLAGASAVAIGTQHFAEPRVGRRILDELAGYCRRHRIGAIADVIGKADDA